MRVVKYISCCEIQLHLFVNKMSALKKISGYPENAVSWAMEKLSSEERCEFEKTCLKLEQFLGEKPKKKNTSRQLPSSRELFEKHIIPIIRDGVRKLEELGERIHKVNVDVNLRTDFKNMTLDDLANAHKKVVKMEESIQTIDNFYKFYRGLLYQAVHGICEPEQFLQWIQKQLVSKTTVYRYMAFATFIMRYPRLIMCDLNFSQLLKHKERILSFMNEEINSKLAHQLAESVEFCVGTTRIVINASDTDVPHITGVAFPTDWKILDTYEDIDLSGISPVSAQGATTIVDETEEELENSLLVSQNMDVDK